MIKIILCIFLCLSVVFVAQSQPISDWERVQTLRHEDNSKVEYVTYNHAGNLIASASSKGDIYIWNAVNKNLVRKLIGHTALVNHLEFSGDDGTLVSASDDGSIKFWHVQSGQLLKSVANADLNSRFKAVNFVTFNPSEDYVYYGGKNYQLNRTKVDAEPNKTPVLGGFYVVTCGVWSPDKKYLVYGAGKNVYFLNLETQQNEFEIKDNSDFINDLQFSNSGKLLVGWSEDGMLYFWDYPDRSLRTTINAGDKGYSHVAFSKDDRFLITGNIGNGFKVWDVATKKILLSDNTFKAPVRTFQFHPSLPEFIAGSYDGSIGIWRPAAPPPPVAPPTPPPPPVEVNERKVVPKATMHVKGDVSISVWDDETVDGDVISLYYNDVCILKNHPLKKNPKQLKLKVEPHSQNLLVLYAHNIGERPPNTAAISLNDGKLQRKINLSSDLNESGAISIIREE